MFISDGDEIDIVETDQKILASDVPDCALERAAGASEGQAVTIGYCTHWYQCNWPL
jgi:hypothetical protein